MRSPIFELQNAIAGAPFRIAPERENELGDWCENEGVALELIDKSGFTFHVYTLKKEIQASVATLEFLWANAHTNLVLYDEYSKSQRRGQQKFETGATSRLRNAINLSKWAINNMLGSGVELWPSHFLTPEKDPTHGSDTHTANELFLCSFAWTMHHELAHIRLGHKPMVTMRSIQEEKEADVEATRWILDKCPDDKQAQKRTYGIVAAILALQSVTNPTARGYQCTHPPTFERIDYCLSESGVNVDNEAYAFAACIMQIQLASRGVNISHDGNNFRELFSEYLYEFAKLFR